MFEIQYKTPLYMLKYYQKCSFKNYVKMYNVMDL